VGFTQLSNLLWEWAPFAGATHCTVLHCIEEQQKTQIKTRGKQQSSSSFAAAHFNPSHITLAFTRENRFAVGRQCTFVPSHLTSIKLLIVQLFWLRNSLLGYTITKDVLVCQVISLDFE
jgi:hypothetical protein